MTPDEQRQYAATLILEHARNIEYMSVFEMAEEHLEDADEISDEDGRAVHDMISKATVAVSFPDSDLEWTNQDDEGEDG